MGRSGGCYEMRDGVEVLVEAPTGAPEEAAAAQEIPQAEDDAAGGETGAAVPSAAAPNPRFKAR